jgi:GNAT superfamily N-acetyltransferase
VSAYRFCRTDDIGLLVDALNRCWLPHFPDEPPMTAAAFKRSIRDLQVWCSSCMVAFAGSDPIGVLIGAKRPSGTLIHKIAVHPDHQRQGHGRHLLTSLGSKLAILGPPRIIAEVPETFAAASGLFSASGYVQEALLTDYVLEGPALTLRQAQGHPEQSRGMSERGNAAQLEGPALSERSNAAQLEWPALSERSNAARVEGFVIPVTVDDLAANGLFGDADPHVCWERSVETLTARKDDIGGLAVASDEQIEAYFLYVKREAGVEIVSLRSFVEDGGARLKQLLSRLGVGTFRFPKVHPAEISQELLKTLGFLPAGGHRLYAARARSE